MLRRWYDLLWDEMLRLWLYLLQWIMHCSAGFDDLSVRVSHRACHFHTCRDAILNWHWRRYNHIYVYWHR